MSPDGLIIFAQVMGAAVAVFGPVYGVSKYLDTRFDKKADKEDTNRQHENVVKLFDKLEEHARRSEDRFTELTETMHLLHRETMSALEKKQDKRR